MQELLLPHRQKQVNDHLLSFMEDFTVPGDVRAALAGSGRAPMTLPQALVGVHGAYLMPIALAKALVSGGSSFHKALALPGAWRDLSGQPRYQGVDPVPAVDMGSYFESERLLSAWPYPPTHSQAAIVREIAGQFAERDERPRLLQGDVGSGKTAVLATAAAMVVRAGYQVAVMAPTDVLADQLYVNLERQFRSMGVYADGPTVLRFSGAMKSREKRALQGLLRSDKPFVAVGTHGLSTQEFGKLSLVIIDEEQRFSASVKSELNRRYPSAHQLLVSATPIPRTLAASIFAGCRVSSLLEKPAGRLPVRTAILRDDSAEKNAIGAIRKIVSKGQQVYIVCPAVESDTMASVKSACEWLDATLGNGITVGTIHGGMTAEKADKALQHFKEGATDVLIGTSILAVGVDVPNATLMIVFDPHMFGVSQLHQIRGRVGRGDLQGYCMLIPTRELNERQLEGLEFIAANSDGFVLAEYDLKMRGEGNFSGHEQSGHGADWSFLAEEAQVMVGLLENRRAMQMERQALGQGCQLDSIEFL